MKNCKFGLVIILIMVTICLPLSGCKGQFRYKNVPAGLINRTNVNVDLSSFRKLADYLPVNYDKTGKTDYTKLIQRAVDENQKILLPNIPLLVNDSGIVLKNNSELYFQSNSKLILKPSKLERYGILTIQNSENITIYNPAILGDRSSHLGKGGEWGMGIFILGGRNIKVINPTISNCWGDGIYLGSDDGGKNNINISILGGILDNNRRNGISVISGKNVVIKNVVLSNTNGTLPMAGIDLEPNKNFNNLNNIRVENTLSYNNSESGYLIYLGSMLGSELKDIDINLINCEDRFSKNGISIPGLRNDYKKDIKRLSGAISIQGFRSFDNNDPFLKSSGNYIYTPAISINGLKVYKNQKRSYDNEKNLTNWMKNNKMKIDTN